MDHTHITVCVKAFCEEPETIPYARTVGNMNSVGMKVKYTCNVASDDEKHKVSTCLEDGHWSQVNLTCLPFGEPIANSYFRWTPHYDAIEVGATKNECGRLCHNSQFCMAFNYNPSTGMCTLPVSNTTDIAGEVTVIPGWEVTKKIFPVFLAVQNDILYNLTKPQAIEHCRDLSTEIATMADVQEANRLGYSVCSCAWVADRNYGVLSMTTVVSECVGTGVSDCRWRNTWNVFCKTTI